MANKRITKGLPQEWRDKIQTSMLTKRLESYVKGEIKLEPAQVTAALGLLKKTMPDLASTALTGADGKNLQPTTYNVTINGVPAK